jgi:hypothetical protein
MVRCVENVRLVMSEDVVLGTDPHFALDPSESRYPATVDSGHIPRTHSSSRTPHVTRRCFGQKCSLSYTIEYDREGAQLSLSHVSWTKECHLS